MKRDFTYWSDEDLWEACEAEFNMLSHQLSSDDYTEQEDFDRCEKLISMLIAIKTRIGVRILNV